MSSSCYFCFHFVCESSLCSISWNRRIHGVHELDTTFYENHFMITLYVGDSNFISNIHAYHAPHTNKSIKTDFCVNLKSINRTYICHILYQYTDICIDTFYKTKKKLFICLFQCILCILRSSEFGSNSKTKSHHSK